MVLKRRHFGIKLRVWVLGALIIGTFHCANAQMATYRVLDNNLNNIHNTYLMVSPFQARAQGSLPYAVWPAVSVEMGHKMGLLGSLHLFFQRQINVGLMDGVADGATPYYQMGGMLSYTLENRIELTEKRISLKDNNLKVPFVKVHGKYLKQYEARLGFSRGRTPLGKDYFQYMNFGMVRGGFQYVTTDRLKVSTRLGDKRFLKQKIHYIDVAYAPFLATTGPDEYNKMRLGLIGGFEIRNLGTIGMAWGLEVGLHPTILQDDGNMQALYAQLKLAFPLISFRLPTPKELLYQLK